ncbi:hypothetical protein K2173_013158 [Erythroxylum novogranatense]|uniref:BAH domain-containing protein n=1 Tax=Erythroxylum novogranatense TaxID=1862640 RepID=A0AAV8S5K2_9ROSI|nr:hypothetical protein K2173_013158 [Erythroxylum novogranatense]
MFTMPLIDHGFSAWEEHIVCPERGSRLVHYYLKNEFGDSVLAVIGTERSIRHMTFVVSNEFLQFFGSNKSINASTKWRARREVVRWLTSMMSRNHPGLSSETNSSAQGSGSIDMLRNEEGACDVYVPDLPFQRKLKVHNSYMEWSGTAWFCTKQLKHYTAFCKTGITIAVHSFVFIMAEAENHYLAYLEDMYEDKKGQKKLKVRWFHYSQEVKDIITQLNPHPREVFRSHNVQVISAYCVTGLATVLTPRHYEKYEAVVPHTSVSDVYMCCRQFKENKVKPFALNKLSGYSSQPLLSLLAGPLVPKQIEEQEELTCNDYMRVWGKRLRSTDGDDGLGCCSGPRDSVLEHQIANHEPTYPKLKIRLLRKTQGVEFVAPQSQFLLPFKVDEKIELLCQDSGIRGCWFRCKVLQASAKCLKVQYDDLLDVDGAGNLQEWVPVAKIAAADRLGMRCWGRHTIRPTPPQHSNDHDFDVGAAVDAWWCDGWWEVLSWE